MLPEPLSSTLVATRDGRRLEVCEWGDPDGAPVFFLHGTPGGALLRHVDVDSGEDVYRARHLRVLTYARPGYGRSTPRPGRRVVDDAADVATIADAMDLDRFAVTGVSGGSGATLATVARLPDRAVRAAMFVGTVPFQADGLDYYEGLDDDEREWHHNATGADAVAFLDHDWAETLAWVRDDLPHEELAPGLREMIQVGMQDGMSVGPEGFRDDYLAIIGDWGFDVSEVRVPVRLLYAEDDSSVPRAHVEWLSDHLPDCEVAWVPGDHFGAGAERERIDRELELLVWAAPDPRS